MSGNQILLILVVIKLLSLKVTSFLYMGQLVLESFVSFVIYVLDVGYILLSFSLRVIVNLEWPVRSQERWISLMMVLS